MLYLECRNMLDFKYQFNLEMRRQSDGTVKPHHFGASCFKPPEGESYDSFLVEYQDLL